jgi:phytoene synthase
MTPKKQSSKSPAGTLRDPAAVLAASTFSAGLQLLPSHLGRDARALYLLLRTIDDLVDERDPEARSRVRAMERWTRGAAPESPETRTLESLSERYEISPLAVGEFCEGMRHDLNHARIETEADLERYCHCVAGTVGIMLAGLLGTTSPEGVERMAKLGAAMQRTNILRDIDEDLAHGRLYIPRTAIERFGFPAPRKREALLRDQIRRADALYEEGMGAIPLLRNGRHAMGLSTVLYREILRQIERDGFGQQQGRAIVPRWRKRILIAEYSRPHSAQPSAADHARPHEGARLSGHLD